jgi:hypothetical protein
MILLTSSSDRFLPFSLSHTHDDQFRFSVGQLPGTDSSHSISSHQRAGSAGNPYTLAGFHEQAVLNATCHRMLFAPPVTSTGENMNNHVHHPTYNMNLVLELLRACLQNNHPAFWAEVSQNHQITVSLTSADALRAEFIRHIFSGGCVLRHGLQCTAVVNGEEWPHSMGIRMIDSVLEWMEQGFVTVNDLVCICGALGITSNVVHKRKCLLKKLVDRRRQLLSMEDAANVSLSELMPQLGCSSSMKTIKSIGASHGVEISDAATKEDGKGEILDHMTMGRCAEGADGAPGCKRVVRDAAPQGADVVHLQVIVLRHIIDIASKKQLCKILELHGIDYEPAEKKKTLKSRLKRYTQHIEKGKLKEIEAESDAAARLQKMDEIRRNWPKLIPMPIKEKIIKDFRAATSSMALASFTCACCAREQAVSERICKPDTEVNLHLLVGPEAHCNDPTFAAPPTPFMSGPLRGTLVDAHGVKSGEEGGLILELCHSCS